MGSLSLLPLCCLSLLTVAFASVQCLDPSGNPVDWWLIFKMGKPVSPYAGYTYAYTDVNTPGTFTIGNLNTTNALSQTIMQIGLYGGKAGSSVGWGMWNDQTHSDLEGACDDHESDGHGGIFGHTKGTIGFDSQTGFWLAHSAPGFPYDHNLCPSSWHFPYSQSIYAQHFFCISISSSDLNTFGNYLQYYHAYVYDSKLPSGMSLSAFSAFTSQKYHKTDGTISFSSLGGQKFVAVGKNSATNSDLYEDYVAPLLKTGLLVQSWCGGTYGKECQPSYCQGNTITEPSDPQKGSSTYAYDSVGIEAVAFNGISYTNSYNHAKWAIPGTFSGTPLPWFCAGDNNREYTQRKRGGGAICMEHPALYANLKTVVTTVNTTCSHRK